MFKPKGTVVSTKTHIGNDRFISLVACYDNELISKIKYNVYQQYGMSEVPLVSLEVSRLGIFGDYDDHYGVNNRALKERAFSTFQSKVLCDEFRNNIKTIIKGVS